MCGRTCLTLDPDQVLCACKYPNEKLQDDAKQQKFATPEWRAEFNLGRRYQASYNIAPTDITPVIVSAAHFAEAAEDQKGTDRIVMPMMWGMIPPWHKGDYRKHGLTTNNCRLEHLMDSKLYRGPFKRGQRCVVLCEGFYEWQTTKQAKPSDREAYLLYVPQEADVKIHDKSTWSPSNVKLLRMAALFDVWQDENGDKMYSYSIITFESTKIMSWMHYRMPAILETEQQMNDWLHFKHVSDSKALAALRPATGLQWHRVGKLVNNSRNKSDECNKPFEAASKPEKPKGMLAWLTGNKQKLHQNKTTNDEVVIKEETAKRSVDEISPTAAESAAKRTCCAPIQIAPPALKSEHEIKLESTES
ncbi:abasic site processing protein HMCES [Drosophila nasuta]|uniref:abasic site processing protein HMCES n=1 Tax=Drosophila nasuta TaxID=42062 RepID=UPI00295F00E6|nr:abasic site processing protein HMCES [Drosophila nasuta]XP_060649184.1 abasic site processing protein HMCES [Drosophila nasuta]